MAKLSTFLIPRRFVLHRSEDESGVSGTGIVAYGIQWPSGHCSLEWRVVPHTQGWYAQVEDLIEAHGHNGKTTLHWLREPYEAVEDPEEYTNAQQD